MFWKCIMCFTFVSVVIGAEVTTYQGVRNEIACLAYGGICAPKDDCAPENRANIIGLCPDQRNDGIECCHAVPMSKLRCVQRGGECIPKNNSCSENLTFKRATDCAAHEKCCILVV